MLVRACVVGLIPLLCAACANEPAPRVMGFTATSAMVSPARADGAPVTGSLRGEGLATPARKTVGDKVLTAIALERVTGRKPDPARFVE